MTITATRQAEDLLIESLKELESPKGSVLVGVQKLGRVARMLEDEDTRIWCEIQLGNPKYTLLLKGFWEKQLKGITAQMILEKTAEKKLPDTKGDKDKAAAKREASIKKSQQELKDFQSYLKRLAELGLKREFHFTSEEVSIKGSESGGGYMNIGVIEEMYADIIRTKSGNIGNKYFQVNLGEHIAYVRRVAHEKATLLYNKIAFSNTPQTSLDILRAEVDNRLLDLVPDLGEKLMIAFKSVSGANPEEWSHALTTCRRFIEDLADVLFPPSEEQVKGRSLVLWKLSPSI